MAHAPAPPRELVVPARGYWVAEDLDELPDGCRYEIVDGALLVNPSPVPLHQRVSGRLRDQLESQLPEGLWVLGDSGVRLGRSVLLPDVLVADATQFDPLVTPIPVASVLLMAETESPSSVSQERVLKPHQYAAAGVAAYWRIELSPALRFVAHVLRDGRYNIVADAGRGVVELAEPFAVSIDLDALL